MTLPLVAYRAATCGFAPVYGWLATRKLPVELRAQRLGQSGNAATGVIWCQAPSLGELRVLMPLLDPLAQVGPLLITTHSVAGAEQAATLAMSSALGPIDTPQAVARFLNTWRPRAAIFVESDTPPNMLNALKKRGIPTALIATRPSKTRRKWPRTMRKLLGQFDVITAASTGVADELRTMGLTVTAVEDLKAQSPALAALPDWAQMVGSRPVWLAASTHGEDIGIVFDAHKALLRDHPDALLMIAPRHAQSERAWLPKGFCPCWHSDNAAPTARNDVFVMDAMGQLPGLHALTSVTYLGGGMGTRGGHSPWEAASAGNHILTGPDITNAKAAFDTIPHRVVTDADTLADAIKAAWCAPRPIPVVPTQSTATRDAVLSLLGEMT